MDLLVITQAFFMLGFVAMAAGTVYFVLERGDLKPEHRIAATYAGIITFIAAIMYWVMTDIVGFFDRSMASGAEIGATMPFRYIDWLLTTPLLLVEFGLIVAIAGAASKGFVTRIVIADIIMIVTGYLGEVGTEGELSTWIWFIISSLPGSTSCTRCSRSSSMACQITQQTLSASCAASLCSVGPFTQSVQQPKSS
jgi:sensory rhodopsin